MRAFSRAYPSRFRALFAPSRLHPYPHPHRSITQAVFGSRFAQAKTFFEIRISKTKTKTHMTILNLLPYVKETRRYGVTYVHSAVRAAVHGWDGLCGTLDGRTVRVTYCGWGRSLQTARGHKYKAHLRYADTNKPVPTKLIDRVQPAPLCPHCAGSASAAALMTGCTCGMSDAEFNAMWSAIVD